MKYAQIRNMDVSNGTGIGVSLFVQGCPHHCYNCFNPETWNFSGGKEWNKEVEDKFFNLISKPYIKRVTFLGGEPLAPENVHTVGELIKEIYYRYKSEKQIWVYTGYLYENLDAAQQEAIEFADVLVDGPFIDSEKDLTLQFKGSKNQRLINIQLSDDEVVLWHP